LGTVIFSTAGGLGEVLISPVIAAIPADDPDREMSKLHSVYAWGVVLIVTFSTIFLTVFRKENWQFLPLTLAAVPLVALILFRNVQIPALQDTQQAADAPSVWREKGLWLFVAGIFFGGAAECTMAQWSSGYLEQALGIPKVWGDLLGVSCFYITLGAGRTLYAEKGKDIRKVLIAGAWGAAACYLLCAITPNALLGLLCCGMTGLFVSMLWPGNLIIASEKYASSGVFIFAIMAAGGDLGASVGPQLVGIIADGVCASPLLSSGAAMLGLSGDQLGMKIGILTAMCFPLCAALLYQKFYPKK
jgi:fucose permease